MKRDEDRRRNDAAYRLDMIQAADAIRSFIRGVTHAKFIKDPMVQSAVERKLGVIGEAAANFTEAARTQYPDVQWNAIVGLRQYMIHVYWQIDPETVWVTAQKDAADLARALRAHELRTTSVQIDDEIARKLSHGAPKKRTRR